jgi:hypothetical protein
MTRDQTVTILRQLCLNKQAAIQFVNNPAAEWMALGGQLPPGVSAAQFSQNMRNSKIFSNIQAVANGQMSTQDWLNPCAIALETFLCALGVFGTAVLGPAMPAVAAFMSADVTVVTAAATGATGGGLYAVCVAICMAV